MAGAERWIRSMRASQDTVLISMERTDENRSPLLGRRPARRTATGGEAYSDTMHRGHKPHCGVQPHMQLLAMGLVISRNEHQVHRAPTVHLHQQVRC